MLNNVVLVGRITKDPELFYTQNKVGYSRFTLAVNRPADKEGERQVDFIDCIVWRDNAKNLVKYISKGDMLGIVGSINIFVNKKDDKTYYNTNITVRELTFFPKAKESTVDPQEPF